MCARKKKTELTEEEIAKKLNLVTGRLIEKLERAIDELDDYVTTVHTKEKTTEYDDEGKKPLVERTVDTEEMHIEKGPVDRAALKQLMGTLKELRGKDEVDSSDDGFTILLSEEAEKYSQ